MKLAKYAGPLAASLIGLFVGAGGASADTFTYGGFDMTNRQLITITQFDASGPLPAPGETGYMGQIVLEGSGVDAGRNLFVWCVDLADFLQPNGTYNIQPLAVSWAGASNPPLTQAQINEIGSLVYHGDLIANSDPNASAAIQLAIWEVEYGAPLSFVTYDPGNVIADLALTYIGYVTGGPWSGSYPVGLLVPEIGSVNQYLALATPLPPAIALLGPVLGAAYFGLRRRCRKSNGDVAGAQVTG